MDAQTVAVLVGRKSSIAPAVMGPDGKITGGETITSNEGHVRLAVFEGRTSPDAAMTEMGLLGDQQRDAHGRSEYERGRADMARELRKG